MACVVDSIGRGGQGARMSRNASPIAVVQGASSEAIQGLLADFAARVAEAGGVRIAGLIECAPEGCHGDAPALLRTIAGGRTFPIFQDLGPGSTACALDSVSLVAAGEQVRADIAAGCDLVVLSKFAKLEAENRSGLLAAFGDAIGAGLPIVTAVSPKFMDRWDAFAAPLYACLPADAAALDAWWQGQGPIKTND
jgi:hypothetical protein